MAVGRIISAKFCGKGVEPGDMHLVISTESGVVRAGYVSWQEGVDAERATQLLRRAVIGLKSVGGFRYQDGDSPHPLDCTLAGRVMHVFGLGLTAASELCVQFGEDPQFRDKHDMESNEAEE